MIVSFFVARFETSQTICWSTKTASLITEFVVVSPLPETIRFRLCANQFLFGVASFLPLSLSLFLSLSSEVLSAFSLLQNIWINEQRVSERRKVNWDGPDWSCWDSLSLSRSYDVVGIQRQGYIPNRINNICVSGLPLSLSLFHSMNILLVYQNGDTGDVWWFPSAHCSASDHSVEA